MSIQFYQYISVSSPHTSPLMQRHSCRVSAAGEGIGIAVQASPSVFNAIIKRLKSQAPLCEPAVVLFQSIKPL